jgi:hypothetical protein
VNKNKEKNRSNTENTLNIILFHLLLSSASDSHRVFSHDHHGDGHVVGGEYGEPLRLIETAHPHLHTQMRVKMG